MLNIDSHIINYKRNALANFYQINNNNIYIYIFFFSKQIKPFYVCENEIKIQQKLLFKNEKCTFVNKI